MKLIKRLLKRNRTLWNQNKIYERLTLCLIRDNDNAYQRNIEAIKYIDSLSEANDHIKKIREILTTFKTINVLDEVNEKESKY